ncbi:Leucine-rich repeat [Macleaya cordata]|uniref:Leucine-rich repeat n=1 Tax=Macleaya cordata TaxID=56857 RepID=A0A200Q8S6_MACCD|nr:Leucine-rich repeat [Macleaya cordata]
MTILRSREIIPKFPPQTLKSRKLEIEPSTPNKAHEPSISSNPSSPSATDPKPDLLGLGFDSKSFSSPTPSLRTSLRRSSRLASKSNLVSEDNNKKLVTEVNVTNLNVDKENESNSGSDSGKGKDGDKRKTRVLGSVKRKSRVSDSVNEKIRVSGEVMDCDEEKKESEEKYVEDLGNLGYGFGSSSLRRSKRLMNAVNGNENGEMEIDLNSLPLDIVSVEEGSETGVLNLQSGVKIAESKMEVIDIDSDENSNASKGSVICERDENQEKVEQNRLADDSGDLEILELDLNLASDRRVVDVEMLETDTNPTVHRNEKSVDMEIDPKPTADESTSLHGKRKYSIEEKGKGKLLVTDSWLSIGIEPMKPEELNNAGSDSVPDELVSSLNQLQQETSALVREETAVEQMRTISKASVRMKAMRRRENRERFQNGARRSAARFAHFQREEEEDNLPPPVPGNEVPSPVVDQEVEDWPGPFSTAMKIIKDRAMKHNAPLRNSTLGASKPAPVIEWMPSGEPGKKRFRPLVPLLQDMCMNILAKNVEAIVSLKDVPDVMRHKLCQLLCDSRRMDSHFMELLVSGSPTEIRVKDCSQLTEEQFTKILEGCDISSLMVLQLDLCGRCLPDYILRATLARSPNSLPALSSISLRGACRLTDVGLKALVASAPSLSSINLGQCSLLSSTGINTLADPLGSVLRELYLDDCQNIDMMLILPALKKLEHLEVLSLADIPTVCDDFVCKFVTVCGPKLKELVFADCRKLTDTSLKAIAENCSGLCALDLANLHKLTNSALGYLANGCRSIRTLKLRGNMFSDEAVAAFLEASGDPLTELSLNKVKKVGHNTAISLARRCSRNLLSLDLSWCRNLSDTAVGLIVDSCSSLRILKLFGCTQITPVFVDGHSNPLVRIVGLKLTPILEHLNMLGLQEAPLRYSSVPLRTEFKILHDQGL